MAKHCGREVVWLQVEDAGVAKELVRDLRREFVKRLAELKVLQGNIEQLRGRVGDKRAIAQKRCAAALEACEQMMDNVNPPFESKLSTGTTATARDLPRADGMSPSSSSSSASFGCDPSIAQSKTAVVLAFGPSWRNAREYVVLSTSITDVNSSEDKIPADGVQAVDVGKTVKHLAGKVWRAFFSLLSADQLAWLSRAPPSRRYGMHLLATEHRPGFAPTSDSPWGFTEKHGVAVLDVVIGRSCRASDDEPSMPPSLGHLYAYDQAVYAPGP
ncbi:hypothetical protein DIPPA_17495 [Diplonema papillatum]|nr:hypothetical protein DIPPA_17495 [Diplonema papillatum]